MNVKHKKNYWSIFVKKFPEKSLRRSIFKVGAPSSLRFVRVIYVLVTEEKVMQVSGLVRISNVDFVSLGSRSAYVASMCAMSACQGGWLVNMFTLLRHAGCGGSSPWQVSVCGSQCLVTLWCAWHNVITIQNPTRIGLCRFSSDIQKFKITIISDILWLHSISLVLTSRECRSLQWHFAKTSWWYYRTDSATPIWYRIVFYYRKFFFAAALC